MADLLTRPATSVDVEPYRDLVLESACTDPKSYLYDVEGLLARPLDAWTKELEQPKRQVILGFSSTEPEKPLGLQRVDISKGSAYMHGLYVKSEARGVGLGKLLVRAGIRAAQEDSRVSTIRTVVLYGNDVSLQLLENEGFSISSGKVVGIERYGRTFGEHELRMEA